MIKEQIFTEIISLLDQRIQQAKLAINAAKESRDNETKSSVGDKYETGRTLMQMEVEKNRVQLNKAELLKKELQKINLQKAFYKADFGSLVRTSQNNYFISAAVGKINVDSENFYCISLLSPIAKVLQGKKVGEKFAFQEREIEIIEIL